MQLKWEYHMFSSCPFHSLLKNVQDLWFWVKLKKLWRKTWGWSKIKFHNTSEKKNIYSMYSSVPPSLFSLIFIARTLIYTSNKCCTLLLYTMYTCSVSNYVLGVVPIMFRGLCQLCSGGCARLITDQYFRGLNNKNNKIHKSDLLPTSRLSTGTLEKHPEEGGLPKF